MALGSEKSLYLIALALLACPGRAFDFRARHVHWRGGCMGTLSIGAEGVAFQPAGPKTRAHAWRWSWEDVQRLDLGDDGRVRVRTYQDRRLLLGRDEQQEFVLEEAPDLVPVYELLRSTTDSRLVARLAAPGERLEWELPAKRRKRTAGVLGVLRVYEDRIVFAADKPGESRTWRDADIALLSAGGPRQLSLVAEAPGGTYEFQLRRSLAPELYERLWLRLEALRGLKLLDEKPGGN